MEEISRHPIDNLELIAEGIELSNEEFEEDIPYLGNNAANLGSVFRKVFRTCSGSFLVERPKSEIVNNLRKALSLGLGHFNAALNPGKVITVDLITQTIETRGVSTSAYIDCFQWLKLFYLALILRDKHSINSLCEIPNSFMEQANLKGDKVDYLIVDVYKGIFDASANLSDLFVAAMDATDPECNTEARIDYLLYLKVPELYLFSTIFSIDSDKYQVGLIEAVTNHKEFWGRERTRYNAEGWVSYPILAAACLAKDHKNFSSNLNSPYLPMWLVEKDYE